MRVLMEMGWDLPPEQWAERMGVYRLQVYQDLAEVRRIIARSDGWRPPMSEDIPEVRP